MGAALPEFLLGGDDVLARVGAASASRPDAETMGGLVALLSAATMVAALFPYYYPSGSHLDSLGVFVTIGEAVVTAIAGMCVLIPWTRQVGAGVLLSSAPWTLTNILYQAGALGGGLAGPGFWLATAADAIVAVAVCLVVPSLLDRSDPRLTALLPGDGGRGWSSWSER